jgi:hypothetical protein
MKFESELPYEDSLVLWLQAGCWFADIRVNLASGEIYSGFGGVVWWQTPRLWFQQLINISGPLWDQDIRHIALTPFGCCEQGTFDRDGQAVCFEEKWQTVHSNTPCSMCWQPTASLARPGWQLREVISSH